MSISFMSIIEAIEKSYAVKASKFYSILLRINDLGYCFFPGLIPM